MKIIFFLIVTCCIGNLFADDPIKKKVYRERLIAKKEFSRSLRLEIEMEKGQNRRDRIEYGKYIYIYVPFYISPSYSTYRFNDNGFFYHYSY